MYKILLPLALLLSMGITQAKEVTAPVFMLHNADPVIPLYDVRATPGLFLVDVKGDIRFNLYDFMVTGAGVTAAMSHSQKAARLAPYWAAAIHQKIDQILDETNGPGQ